MARNNLLLKVDGVSFSPINKQMDLFVLNKTIISIKCGAFKTAQQWGVHSNSIAEVFKCDSKFLDQQNE